MSLAVKINPIVFNNIPVKEFDEVLDFECLIGEKITAESRLRFKHLIAEHLHALKARGIPFLKYKANGGLYTVSDPEYVDFALEPAGNIQVTVNSPASVLGYEKDFSEIIREVKTRIKRNMSLDLGFMPKQSHIAKSISKEEDKARQTLRDLISEKEWRRYLANGYVLVKGSKRFFEVDTDAKKLLRGLQGPFVYQVFSNQSHIKVYSKGRKVKEICIHTDASECPPTDHILNMMMMLKHDEADVWDSGNIYEVSEPTIQTTRHIGEEKNLVEFYKSVKEPIDKVYVATNNFIDSIKIEAQIA